MKTRIISLLIIITVWSCNSDQYIMTVSGPIPVSEMGITLEHEHILVDFIGADSSGYHRWNKEDVIEKALPYLEEIRELDCRTFIECTPAYLGRDPELLRIISEKTGLNIITNIGWYGARGNLYIPERAFEMRIEDIAEEWISEFRHGIEDTGVRPGFIKIGVDRDDTLSLMHEKLIRAAALTHLETGLVIKSHTGPEAPAFAQLAVLEEMEVPAEAFIWTHSQRGNLEAWIMAAKMGAWISLDNVRSKNIEEHVKNLQDIRSAGLLDHVLISHDSGWYRVGEENGGNYNGYTAIFKELLPALKEKGFAESEINLLMVENPARAFRIRIVKH
ncbi:MAG TPA: phosphotriesterase [Bacteroides sp.]|nr:phosphotriesterase [Bacteroides sp.]